jgi:hypothetical protein
MSTDDPNTIRKFAAVLLLMLCPAPVHCVHKTVCVLFRRLGVPSCAWNMLMTAITTQLQLLHKSMTI